MIIEEKDMTPELWMLLTQIKVSVNNYFCSSGVMSEDDKAWIMSTFPIQLLSDILNELDLTIKRKEK